MAQPHCLYCDTPRPADEPRCPECGHPWIDKTIAEAMRPSAPLSAATPGLPMADEAPGFERLEARGERKRWVFPVAVTGGAVLLYAIVFLVLLDRSGGDQDPGPIAGATTTSPAADTTLAPPTTDTAPATTTTVPPTTTSTSSTTTTTTTTVPPIPALGDPIPIEELTLGAFALGPLEFGDEDTNALGRLVATFGQPDDLREIGEADGLCPTEIGRAARFGWLTVLFRGGLVEVLVGYRLEQPEAGAGDHPTAELETISGAKIGDTVNTWASIYSTFVVDTIEIDGRQFFLLARSSDERTLLWAPLSADEPAIVTGIYSPRACDGGPFR